MWKRSLDILFVIFGTSCVVSGIALALFSIVAIFKTEARPFVANVGFLFVFLWLTSQVLRLFNKRFT